MFLVSERTVNSIWDPDGPWISATKCEAIGCMGLYNFDGRNDDQPEVTKERAHPEELDEGDMEVINAENARVTVKGGLSTKQELQVP